MSDVSDLHRLTLLNYMGAMSAASTGAARLGPPGFTRDPPLGLSRPSTSPSLGPRPGTSPELGMSLTLSLRSSSQKRSGLPSSAAAMLDKIPEPPQRKALTLTENMVDKARSGLV